MTTTLFPSPLPTRRADLLARLGQLTQGAAQTPHAPAFDLAVIGGGASGLGVALDAAARGYTVLLLEAHDFAKGTSSRSTKLVHGGVRYLAQGRLGLVREALHERQHLLANAPHLVQPLSFVMPAYHCWEAPFYGAGLKLYDVLAGSAGLGATEWLGAAATQKALPGVAPAGLRGGVRYWDAQFDDARLALALARTAARHGALLLNYCPVRALSRDAQGRVNGLQCEDAETGQRYTVTARCVVNATGVWLDGLRQAGAAGRMGGDSVMPSQGAHLVVNRAFLPGDSALLVPSTADGRVLFAVPWLGKLILGTTDTPRTQAEWEPQPLTQEVDFILAEAGRYLARAPTRADVRSAWAGLRPLVQTAGGGAGANTGAVSREHAVWTDADGLVCVSGGKWTTYRAMAEDVLAHCAAAGLLPARPGHPGVGVTAHLPLVGAEGGVGGAGVVLATGISEAPGWHLYGAEQAAVAACAAGEMQEELAPGLTVAMVRFSARHEYARTVEDVLARRARWLFLDAAQAQQAAPRVAEVLQQETGRDPELAAFLELAQRYRIVP